MRKKGSNGQALIDEMRVLTLEEDNLDLSEGTLKRAILSGSGSPYQMQIRPYQVFLPTDGSLLILMMRIFITFTLIIFN